MQTSRIPIEDRIASIFIHVTDLQRAAVWYSELLGLPLLEERLNGGPVYWFDLPGTGLILDNDAYHRQDPAWSKDDQPLVMFACDDIDEAYAYVSAKAEPLFPPERHIGMAYFNFRAPDGRVYMACWSKEGEKQFGMPENTSPVCPLIGGVFINVCDMKQTAAWISDLLGMALRPDEMNDTIYEVPVSRGASMLLDDNRVRRGETFEIPFMFDTNDIDAAYAYAVSRSMQVFHGIERHGEIAFFTLADPDGNLVMVCQSTEGAIDGYTLVQLPVRNLRQSVKFYTEILGFVLQHPERPVQDHIFLRTRSGQGPGLHLCEVAEGEFKVDHWQHNGQLVHGLELHSRDIRALHKRLVQAGVRIESVPYFVDVCGGYVKFYDPDGHLICVNQGAE